MALGRYCRSRNILYFLLLCCMTGLYFKHNHAQRTQRRRVAEVSQQEVRRISRHDQHSKSKQSAGVSQRASAKFAKVQNLIGKEALTVWRNDAVASDAVDGNPIIKLKESKKNSTLNLDGRSLDMTHADSVVTQMRKHAGAGHGDRTHFGRGKLMRSILTEQSARTASSVTPYMLTTRTKISSKDFKARPTVVKRDVKSHWDIKWNRTIQNYLDDQLKMCVKDWIRRNVSKINDTAPRCSCSPDTLLGFVGVNMTEVPLNETNNDNQDVQPGGHWQPTGCTAQYNIAIVVPFRDRHSHLPVLLRHLHPILQGQQANYTILVVEQKYPETFNKAAIMNVGYHYAIRGYKPDCVIFHDVDFIPEDGRHFYRCQQKPLHLGAYHDQHKYKLLYPDIFGAVTAFTPEQFETVNGFSNLYYGWGGEDDDMAMRVLGKFKTVLRDPREVAGYHTIPHKSDKGNVQKDKVGMLQHLFKLRNDKIDGINSLRFKFRKMVTYPLYTWILVDILKNNTTPILKHR